MRFELVPWQNADVGLCDFKRAQERRRQEGESVATLVWSLLACCLQCIWGLIEYITKFATVRAAITGEAFFEAGRNVTQLLTRNFLKAYGGEPLNAFHLH